MIEVVEARVSEITNRKGENWREGILESVWFGLKELETDSPSE